MAPGRGRGYAKFDEVVTRDTTAPGQGAPAKFSELSSGIALVSLQPTKAEFVASLGLTSAGKVPAHNVFHRRVCA